MVPPQSRMSAEDRREQVLDAALIEFAGGGLAGTSTESIAARAGISQPYLFRLFSTKKELFVETAQRCFDNIAAAFENAAVGLAGVAAIEAMGKAYMGLIADRSNLLAQLQMYAACDDPEIGAVTRREFGRLWRQVQESSGLDEERLQPFFAMGMLMNVMAAMDATSHPAQWVKACLPPAWMQSAG